MERSFERLTRFRRLARDLERLPGNLEGRRYLAFASLVLDRVLKLLASS